VLAAGLQLPLTMQAMLSLMGALLTNSNPALIPEHHARADSKEQSELPLATVAFLLTASWRIFLWRARAHASYLQEKASKLWTDGTPMVSHDSSHHYWSDKFLVYSLFAAFSWIAQTSIFTGTSFKPPSVEASMQLEGSR
jgi:hypothetical protein